MTGRVERRRSAWGLAAQLSALLGAMFLGNVDVAIANVAGPSIKAGLHASGGQLELIVSGYTLAYAVLLVTCARLGQARRLVVLSAGAVAGQSLGGLLISADVAGTTWRPAFGVNIPIGLALLWLAWRYLPADGRQASSRVRLDTRGVAVLSAALVLLVLPLVLGQGEGWPAWTWACLAASVPAFVLLWFVERKQGQPLVDPGLLAQRSVGWGLASQAAGTAAYFATAARLVRFYHPDHAALLATEPGARNLELYPVFVGADVDFIIGGEVARIPDFRPRLKDITVPVMVLAGRYDRALYPRLQRQFTEFDPRIRLEFLERSGSFSHVEEPEAVFALIREFTGQ